MRLIVFQNCSKDNSIEGENCSFCESEFYNTL